MVVFLSNECFFSDIKEIQNCRQEDDIENGKNNTEDDPFIAENEPKPMDSEKGMIYKLINKSALFRIYPDVKLLYTILLKMISVIKRYINIINNTR